MVPTATTVSSTNAASLVARVVDSISLLRERNSIGSFRALIPTYVYRPSLTCRRLPVVRLAHRVNVTRVNQRNVVWEPNGRG